MVATFFPRKVTIATNIQNSEYATPIVATTIRPDIILVFIVKLYRYNKNSKDGDR